MVPNSGDIKERVRERKKPNNREWDTTTFKITLYIAAYQRARSLWLASSIYLIQAKVLQMRIIVDGFF